MHIHVHIKRWVIWWFYVGVICGVIAGANILGHSLTVFQERLLLIVGAAFWLLGGVVCWAYEAVAVEPPAATAPTPTAKPKMPVNNGVKRVSWRHRGLPHTTPTSAPTPSLAPRPKK